MKLADWHERDNRDMNRPRRRQIRVPRQAGFSLLELLIVVAILTIVMTAVFNGINQITQRSQAEQVKVDLTQEGREFVDEFERDLHQAGYPNCRMVATGSANCPADYTLTGTPVAKNSAVAAGLVYVSSTRVVFEGDVDGDGVVDTVWYQLVDSAGNYPPTGTCPCTIQRGQKQKVNSYYPLDTQQQPNFTQELQNVVNSGQPSGTSQYGGGLSISGSTAWGATNSAYYAAISSFKDYPVFQAYDQNGLIISMPQDLSAGSTLLNCSATSTNCVKSIRLTINLLATTTNADMKTKIRPVMTLVGDARLVNN
jgi:prepilin-type N-terminal cleavage/methylation domain-containing protein